MLVCCLLLFLSPSPLTLLATLPLVHTEARPPAGGGEVPGGGRRGGPRHRALHPDHARGACVPAQWCGGLWMDGRVPSPECSVKAAVVPSPMPFLQRPPQCPCTQSTNPPTNQRTGAGPEPVGADAGAVRGLRAHLLQDHRDAPRGGHHARGGGQRRRWVLWLWGFVVVGGVWNKRRRREESRHAITRSCRPHAIPRPSFPSLPLKQRTTPPSPHTRTGFFCAILSRRRGLISTAERDRILAAMRAIGLPTMVPQCSVGMLHKVR